MEHNNGAYRHWQIESERDGILWLSLARADKDINTLSRDVLEEFARILDDILRHPPAGLVILSGKPLGFIAGADVTEFPAIVSPAEALKTVEWVHAIFGRLERLPFPTVCVIRGCCLGGGLELALACRSRIVVDSQGTEFGMPEVKLGIHPGFGGTVRLIRQIGPLAGLGLMLSGNRIDARRALELGLVDRVVPEHEMRESARAAVLRPPSRRKRFFPPFLFKTRLARRFLAGRLRRRIARRGTVEQHYPAPFAILDLWERFGGNPETMSREEARSVARLATGATARNLVRIFLLQERMKTLGRKEESSARTVHVIGAGTMGGDIAAWCALQGLRVTLQDVEQQRLTRAVERASSLFRNRIKNPGLLRDALGRLVPDLRGEGVRKADVVIEAIFEDPAAKRELYQQVEPQMRLDALLATNTSSIPLEELAGSLRNPDRFVGLHFFNPVAKMRLVEVVRGKAAGTGEIDRALGFVAAIDRLPLPVVSSPGFLINRILMPYLMEAVTMEEGGIPAGDIDGAAREFGMPMGPILLADTIGLDVCLSVARILAGHYRIEVPKRLEDLVATGRLGKKSGQGFYAYEKGRPVTSREKSLLIPGRDLEDRLILRLLNESIACWRQGIVADADLLDAGAVFGIGFAPFRGGPLNYIRAEGAAAMRARLQTLQERYGNRFAADPGWREFADTRQGGTFSSGLGSESRSA